MLTVTPPSPLVLALDIGTSSTRAMAFDTQGVKIGLAVQRPYVQATTVNGGVEVDADELLELTASCLDELLTQLKVPIVAVGISCFWHSLLAVDSAGRALTGVLSWADNRAAGQVPLLRSLLDETITHARTGCVLHTSYWPAKLLWLHDTRPELFTGGTRWMSFGEYLALKLCGEARVSLSMASGTGLFDQLNCDWDNATLAVLPLEREQLVPLCDAHDVLPPLRPQWAARWPQLKDARWFPALGDGACSNIGSGCVTPAHIGMNVGTSGALRMVIEDYAAPAPRGLWRYRIDKKRSIMGGAVSNAGNVLLWTRNTLMVPRDWDSQIAAMEPDAHGLTVLPFLAGERSPLWNAHAKLVIEGATLAATPLKIMRACLEAVALRFAEIARAVLGATEGVEKRATTPQGIGPTRDDERAQPEIIFSGGALKVLPPWAQIMCDAIGTPLVESLEEEASARGAALMALEACGIISNVAAVPAERGGIFQPNLEHHQIYRQALERQYRLYEQHYGVDHQFASDN